MCDTFILHFYRIFDCFWKKGQVLFIQNFNLCRDIAYQAAVCFLFAEKNFHIFCKCFYIFVDAVIWKKSHAVFCQSIQNFCRKCILIGKQLNLFLSHYQIRQDNRAAMYISATDV